MLRIGIIGCGTIAEVHADIISSLSGCRITSVCDKEKLMAKQFAHRYNVKNYFADVDSFINASTLDVVHITTPPQAHFELGMALAAKGINLYVEKPFCITFDQADRLISYAQQQGVKVTAGHDHHFSHVEQRFRKLVRSGYLGDPPYHMESYYFYDLSDIRYASALVKDRNHWVRKIPGQLLHNNISHGICRIAEFFSNQIQTIVAKGHTSEILRSIDDSDIIDELRVMLVDKNRSTAYFTFSSQMKPNLHAFRILGTKNGIYLDHHQQMLLKLRGKKYKSYLNMFLPPIQNIIESSSNLNFNFRKFLGMDFHMKKGMKTLIGSFYDAIVNDKPLPIAYSEILKTKHIMESIFAQL